MGSSKSYQFPWPSYPFFFFFNKKKKNRCVPFPRLAFHHSLLRPQHGKFLKRFSESECFPRSILFSGFFIALLMFYTPVCQIPRFPTYKSLKKATKFKKSKNRQPFRFALKQLCNCDWRKQKAKSHFMDPDQAYKDRIHLLLSLCFLPLILIAIFYFK